MIGLELALAASLHVHEPRAAYFPRVPQLRVAQTGSSETPLPADLLPTALLDMGTQSSALPKDVGDLLRTAGAYIDALEVLPVDPEIDEAVEAFVRSKDRSGGKRPLRRKS